MSNYFSAHNHSNFSIRDSITKVSDFVVRAKELDWPAVCLTEHGTISSSYKLFSEAKKHSIKPIFGVEIYMATRSRTQKEAGIDKYFHLTLLGMNNIGWQNIVHLVSEGYKSENFYYKPRIDRELLRKYSEGVICLSGCVGGNISNSIMKDLDIDFEDEEGNTSKKVECATHDHTAVDVFNESYLDVIKWHHSVFGDRFYLEVQNHGMPAEARVADVIFDVSNKLGIKTIATGDTHFVHEEDEKAHDIMLAIRDDITIHDDKMKKIKYPGNGYYLMDEASMLSRFPGHSEAIYNSMELVERCNVEFNIKDFRIPKIADVHSDDDILRELTYKGLHNKYGNELSKDIIDRAEEELTVIQQMTFPNYFLMVSDYVNWAKNNDIRIGEARGSAAGSIVSYALNITEVDPLKYKLSFARFLNRGRCSVPQIDFKEYPFEEWKTNNKIGE